MFCTRRFLFSSKSGKTKLFFSFLQIAVFPPGRHSEQEIKQSSAGSAAALQHILKRAPKGMKTNTRTHAWKKQEECRHSSLSLSLLGIFLMGRSSKENCFLLNDFQFLTTVYSEAACPTSIFFLINPGSFITAEPKLSLRPWRHTTKLQEVEGSLLFSSPLLLQHSFQHFFHFSSFL